MDKANLRLSPTEMDLVLSPDWILTKNEIINKVKMLFAGISLQQQAEIKNFHLPAEVLSLPPKISKGENYQGLPYIILDYPRYFDSENIFAIRTMFWWGKFFSLTLQLSGLYRQMFTERIIERSGAWKENDFHFCINEDPWQHDFSSTNYKEIDPGFADLIRSSAFIKLAKNFPLKNWEESIKLIKKDYSLIINLLTPHISRLTTN